MVQALTRKPKEWVDFMMRFELGLEEPDPKRAVQSALTIAASYIAGGIIPLAPYMALHSARSGAALVGCRDPDRVGHIRLHQGPLHWFPTRSLGIANCCYRWTCCGAAFGLAKLIS